MRLARHLIFLLLVLPACPARAQDLRVRLYTLYPPSEITIKAASGKLQWRSCAGCSRNSATILLLQAAGSELRIRDAGGIQPAAQALMCPMLDDRTGARRELDAIDHSVWNNRSNRAAWSWYLGQPAGSSAVPALAAAARCASLGGLPSAWIGVGGVDLFLEEDRRYAERMIEAGVG